jgi:flagellin
MQRMRELGVQASNDTLSTEDRDAVNTELQQLAAEVNNIGDTSRFNGKNLLTGALTTTLAGATGADAVVGDTLTTTGGNATITGIDVKGARAGETYTMTFSGTNLTMTRGSDSVAQTIAVGALGANASSSLNFSQLGVSINVQADTGGKTAVGLATDLGTAASNNDSIVTAAGSGGANFQIGANASDAISVSFSEVRLNGTVGGNLTALNTALTNFNTTKSVANAQSLITAVDNAINTVNDRRSVLGAAQNRLEHTINNLGVAGENLKASESRIRDADMAKEMAGFTRNQILQQAGTAILAQANQIPQGVLSLLR